MSIEADNYEGQGGSYLLNTKTGKRELVERTEEAAAPVVAEEPAPVPADEPAAPSE